MLVPGGLHVALTRLLVLTMTEQTRAPEYAWNTKLSDADIKLGSHLVTFETVNNPTEEEQRLAKDIVLVDHRSLRLLGPDTKQRAEVRDLIINSVGMYYQRAPQAARSVIDRANAIFLQHMQAKNRLRYILGVVLGSILMGLFGIVLARVPGLAQRLIPVTQFHLVLVFALMGTITSVMLRLSSIDLRDQTNAALVVLSGATRPITAVIFALVLYLLMSAKLVEIHFGAQDEVGRESLIMLVSFLCGFSERFASDILSRFGGELGPVNSPDAVHVRAKSQSGRAS
jgi:hypothetical protein